ncbi:amino acid deaminase/aldolase [Streptomyces triticirhizae]|uniref:Amino acid deaminase/aldolase n=1 Tax=Streptomyces triticirhizae TaxID=2483353 RepID=A0A3M2M3L2_9ACTN|nr:amino acid deaminase/aldolase [Streptomyces triticirhizae]RMI44146.1 amino acid deaminase/aldolase [Streptomyces triticirhizae]
MAQRAADDETHARLERATAALDPPFAVVDLAAYDANAADLARRALGKPLRVASKSLRCRALTRRVLARRGFAGVLAYTLPEALWLASDDIEDVVVGYPTADRAALRRLADDERLARRVTLMVDSVAHLDLLREAARPSAARPLRLCLELDASLRLFGDRLHIGARRSPVRSPATALALARAVADRPEFRLVGLMAYESQTAGVGDAPPGAPLRGLAVRATQRASVAELRERRAEAVAAVREVADLEFVNGGGTGSVERTAAEPAVTEIAAGSGLYGPVLFDGYRSFRPRPAAYFALPVVRRPAPDVATVLGGGWIASGPPGADRQPRPVFPPGLRLRGMEGAGEVQTPLLGRAAHRLRIGDRVWFRHAKAGELAEHVRTFHLVDGERVVAEAPTYRGEGHAFL